MPVHDVDSPSGPLRLAVTAASDRGRVRAVNEDSYLAELPVFAVADGMGGHALGDRASAAAVGALSSLLTGKTVQPDAVVAAVAAANTAVGEVARDQARGKTSGTTLTGIALVNAGVPAAVHWLAFNVGDSRLYSWDGRELRQLSVDHSAVQELLQAGLITHDEALVHPERNVITRALGPHDAVQPDVWLLPVLPRQTFLICSDGLSKELSDEQMAMALAGPPKEGMTTAEHLVSLALEAGGRDNVTAIVVEATLESSAQDEETTMEGARSLEETLPRN